MSRNGNLLLNFPLPGSGALDDRELAILAEITKWMAVNSEGIYSTRPWKIFGEGPGTEMKGGAGGHSRIRCTAVSLGRQRNRAAWRWRTAAPRGTLRGSGDEQETPLVGGFSFDLNPF